MGVHSPEPSLQQSGEDPLEVTPGEVDPQRRMSTGGS